jgi:organic hydroperoxide reductase OsmC/OhrA
MQDFPHHYQVLASAHPDSDVTLSGLDLPVIRAASPAAFDGPGDRWSPETLLVGAVAACFILTFRAVARASKLPWIALRCEVGGMLERVDRVTRFTAFDLTAELRVGAGTAEEFARRALEKAERGCLISNSLTAPVHLHARVVVGEPADASQAVSS